MSVTLKLLLFVFILVRVSTLDVYSQIPTNTLPSLKTIDAGSVNVSTSNNSLNINQSSQQAIISWNSFNVGSSAKVNFNQPSASATTLNKILMPDLVKFLDKLMLMVKLYYKIRQVFIWPIINS